MVAPTVTATKSVSLFTDADSDLAISPGDTLKYTVAIGASGEDATGVMFSDTLDANLALVPGSVMTTPLALNDSYSASGNIRISIAAPGVLANDVDPDGVGPALTASAGPTSTQGGNVNLNADGSFTYNPPPGFEGTDTFTYTINDGEGNTDTATVTITVSGMIWFVNNTASCPCDGRLTNPFNTLAAFNAVNDGAGNHPAANDNIFLYESATDYVGPVTLLSNQRLIGQDATASLSAITGVTPPAGSDPLPVMNSGNGTIVNITSAGNGVNVASGNTLRGFTGGNAATDINGTGFGTLTIADVTLNGTGQALNLSTGTLAATFVSISSTNSTTTGSSLTSVAGSLSSGSTSMTNPTGIGLSVNTSSAALNFGNTTSTLSGGTGVSLTTNTGTITFGTLNISPGANQKGLLATDNTLTITSAGGAISTSGAAAVEITRASGTTPLVISQTSVSLNNPSGSGGASGIILTNTSGSFTVTGDNNGVSNNGSGGTIKTFTGNGVALSNVTNVSLGYMNIQNANSGDDGIHGTTVNGLTLNRCNITNNGNSATDDGVDLTTLLGSVSITNTDVTGSAHNNLVVTNSSGTLASLTITGGNFSTNSAANGNDGMSFTFNGTSVVTSATISGVTFTGNKTTALQTLTNQSANVQSFIVTGCIFHENNIGIDIQCGDVTPLTGASIKFKLQNNTIVNLTRNAPSGANTSSHAINVNMLVPSTGTLDGKIDNNIIGSAATAGSGSSLGSGIRVVGNNQGHVILLLSNNTIRECPDGRGIDITGRNGTGTLEATIATNNVNHVNTGFDPGTSDFPLAAIFVNSTTAPTAGYTVKADIRGNTVPSGTAFDLLSTYIAVVRSGASNCQLVDNPPTPSANATTELTESHTNPAHNNTGSASANAGVVLIAGPLTQPSIVINKGTGKQILPGGVNAQSLMALGSAFNNHIGMGGVSIGASPFTQPSLASPLMISLARQQTSGGAVTEVTTDPILWAVKGENPDKEAKERVAKLTQAELFGMVQAAMSKWSANDLSIEEMQRLQAMTFEIADLPDGQLAVVKGNRVLIDETAAGYGWFLDWSPEDDGEFAVPVPDKESQVVESSPAFDRMDLLTVVMRELGQTLNQETLRSFTGRSAIMEGALGTGVRRMPTGVQLERIKQTDKTSAVKPSPGGAQMVAGAGFGKAITPNALGMASAQPMQHLSAFSSPVGFTDFNRLLKGRTMNSSRAMNTSLFNDSVSVAIGTLPAGKSITITFLATINSPMPSGVCQVSNQGTVTGTNFSPVSTNTVTTPVATPPAITGATLSRQQGTAASTSQIATVSDCNQTANTLAVTVNGGASATVNGVTVNSISVDGSGNVTASVVASCTATTANFTLTVTDNTNKTATANLTVNVTANTPPTLGTYPNTTVTPGNSTTVTPSAAPTDNGTVASLTASAPGFTGTFSGNTSTGVITITNANPPGIYTVTVTATDNCGAITTTTFTLTVNTPPTITGATISRQQGTAASTSQIATVSDADQPANTLTVTVNGGASATVNGVTVSGISIDGSGNVTASVVASCTATNASFTLTVTDNLGATATATLTVNVAANTPPTLGTYPTTTVSTGGSTTVTPSAAPTDNGTVASLTASAPGFTGTFSGNTSTGVITITNAGPVGTYTVTVTATDNCGAITTTTFTLTVNTPPTITGATISRQQGTAASTSQIATVSDADQPANTLTVTVNGGASATVNGVTVSGISIDGSGNVTASVVASCSASNASFTLTVTDNQGATANATLTVNVTANTPPTLGTYPNTTVSPGGSTTVTPSAAPTDNGSVVSLTASAPGFSGTFSGNTSTGVITITNANPPGNYTVTVTATDNCGATTTRTFTLNVNTPPTITGATITRQQGAPASVSQIATVSDPDQPANTLTVTVTPATGSGVTVSGVSVNAAGQVTASVAASCAATNSTFTVTVTDNQGASSSATLIVNVTPNTAPAVTITGPPSGSLYSVGTSVNFTGTFTDNTAGTHTAQWTFTSTTNTFTQAGTVNEIAGTVSASFTFNTAGVYQVTLAVTDACGLTGTANTVNGLLALVVIFDPDGAFVTGGGFINSPAGAYVANPSLTGQANFGLNAKYKNNDTVPTGDTEFHFNAANFNFKSTSYDYLVVEGARAQYQGSGKVNNGGNYGFIVTVIDGKVAGGGGVDKFRIKIWDKNNGNAVVYDSQLGAPDTANPTTPLGGGSIVIHN